MLVCLFLGHFGTELMPKMAQPCEKPPLYLRLRMGRPVDRSKMPTTTPIMSYGKKKMKSEYWFSIPRDKSVSVLFFFLVFSSVCSDWPAPSWNVFFF